MSRWLLQKTSHILPALYFLPALSYQLLAGWGVGYLYTSYYPGGDTWGYYHDALILSQLFWEHPALYLDALFGNPLQLGLQFIDQPRALFFARLSSVISIFSLDSYWLISLTYSCLGFLAGWWFISRLKYHFKLRNYQVFIPFILYPSVTFWSTGLLKESLTLAVIYLLTGMMLHFYFSEMAWTKKNILKLLLAGVLSLVLWKLKYYYAAVLLPLTGFILFLKWLKKLDQPALSSVQRWMIASLTVAIFVLLLMQLHPNLHPERIMAALVLNHDLTVAASSKGAYVAFPELKPEVLTFIRYFPKAVLNGLFAPLPWLQGTNLLHFLAGLENLLLLLLTIWCAIAWSKKKFSMKKPDLVLVCLMYILLLAWLIPIASPNFGSLIRYRVAYMPFYTFLVLLILKDQLDIIFSQSRKKM